MRAPRAHTVSLLVAVAVAACAAAVAPPVHAGTPGNAVRVIVNPTNPVSSVDHRFVADAFLKRTTRWPGDQLIRPVDLSVGSATRRRFSDDVIGRSVDAVKSYWQQMIFSGRGVPPPELDSEDQVVKFVLKNPGAIGYVSASTDVGSAKVVSVR